MLENYGNEKNAQEHLPAFHSYQITSLAETIFSRAYLENAFPQTVTHILQKAFSKHALVVSCPL